MLENKKFHFNCKLLNLQNFKSLNMKLYIIKNWTQEPGTLECACSHSYLGSWGLKITMASQGNMARPCLKKRKIELKFNLAQVPTDIWKSLSPPPHNQDHQPQVASITHEEANFLDFYRTKHHQLLSWFLKTMPLKSITIFIMPFSKVSTYTFWL
jgi:hypothetical protein